MIMMDFKTILKSGTLLALLGSMLACGGGGSGTTVPNPTMQQNPDHLYVVNTDDGTVSGFNIDPASGTLTSTGPAVATGDIPAYAAAAPNGRFLYVANTAVTSNSISGFRIDATTGVLTPTSPAAFPITRDNLPLGMEVDPASKHVYTANVGSISAFNIDPLTGALSEMRGSPVFAAFGESPQALKISPDGQFLFVTNGLAGTVSTYKLNADGLPVEAADPVATGLFPVGLVVDPAGKFVYVANTDADDVTSFSITPGTGVLVPVDRRSVQAGCAPMELAIDPESKFLFVSCSGIGENSIEQFDINSATGSVAAVPQAFPTGLNTTPRGVAVDTTGRFLFSALASSNQLSTESIAANGTLTPVGVSEGTGKSPVGVVIVRGH